MSHAAPISWDAFGPRNPRFYRNTFVRLTTVSPYRQASSRSGSVNTVHRIVPGLPRFLTPTDALPVKSMKRIRRAHDPVCHCDCSPELFARQMPDCRAFDDSGPRCPDSCIEADTHEAMVAGNRPTALLRHARQHITHQHEPLRQKCGAILGMIDRLRRQGRKQRMLVCHRFTRRYPAYHKRHQGICTAKSTSLRRSGPGVNGSL